MCCFPFSGNLVTCVYIKHYPSHSSGKFISLFPWLDPFAVCVVYIFEKRDVP